MVRDCFSRQTRVVFAFSSIFFRDKLSNIYAPDRQVSDVIKEGGSLGYGAGRGGSYFGYCER